MAIISRLINIPLLKFLDSNRAIITGLFIMLIASGLLFIVSVFIKTPLVIILLCMMLFILGSGIICPNCTASALSNFRHMGGVAGSLYASLQTFGAFFAGIIVSYLANTVVVLAVSLLLLVLVALIVVYTCCIIGPSSFADKTIS